LPYRNKPIDGRIILRWIFKKWDGEGVEWIDMAQDRDRWLKRGHFGK
jgi:hypothetical protein